VIYGEHINNWNYWQYYRYHLDISTVPREGLSMQGLVDGDNNRTPVFFQGLDDYRIVGDTKGFRTAKKLTTHRESASLSCDNTDLI